MVTLSEFISATEKILKRVTNINEIDSLLKKGSERWIRGNKELEFKKAIDTLLDHRNQLTKLERIEFQMAQREVKTSRTSTRMTDTYIKQGISQYKKSQKVTDDEINDDENVEI